LARNNITVNEYLLLKDQSLSDDEIAKLKGIHPNTLLYWKRKNDLIYKVESMKFEFLKNRREYISPKDFSEFVYHMRKSIAFTRRDFAAAMGVSISTIIHWENSKEIPREVHSIVKTMRIVVKLRIKNKRLIA